MKRSRASVAVANRLRVHCKMRVSTNLLPCYVTHKDQQMGVSSFVLAALPNAANPLAVAAVLQAAGRCCPQLHI
jgi:hypothetical protein